MATATEIQLDPPITVDTPKGKGEAYFKTQYGPDSYSIFGVFMRDTGDFLEFRAPFVKLYWNESMGTGRKPGAEPIPATTEGAPKRVLGTESTKPADSVKRESGSITGGVLATVDWDSAQPGKINVSPAPTSMCRVTREVCQTPLSCSIHCQVVERSQRGQAQQKMHQAHEDLTKGTSLAYEGLSKSEKQLLADHPAKLVDQPRYVKPAEWVCCSVCRSPGVCSHEMKCLMPLPDPEPKPLNAFRCCALCTTATGCTVNGFCRREVRV